jgi:hypothetical protein
VARLPLDQAASPAHSLNVNVPPLWLHLEDGIGFVN